MKSLVIERFQISSEAAELAVQASARLARSLDVAVSIALVDTGGHLVAFLRSDGAAFHTRGIAEDKAVTGGSFGIPTKALGEALQSRSEEVRSVLRLRPQLVALGGGLPISVDGKLVGAIGVSGATEEIDERIAAEGLAAISEVSEQA